MHTKIRADNCFVGLISFFSFLSQTQYRGFLSDRAISLFGQRLQREMYNEWHLWTIEIFLRLLSICSSWWRDTSRAWSLLCVTGRKSSYTNAKLFYNGGWSVWICIILGRHAWREPIWSDLIDHQTLWIAPWGFCADWSECWYRASSLLPHSYSIYNPDLSSEFNVTSASSVKKGGNHQEWLKEVQWNNKRSFHYIPVCLKKINICHRVALEL